MRFGQASPSRASASCGRHRWSTGAALLLAVATTTTPQRVAAATSSSYETTEELEFTESSLENCVEEREACQDDAVCLKCYSVITPATRDAWETCISSVATDDLCAANAATLCCYDELSSSDCMSNDAFVEYYGCGITSTTGEDCEFSCDLVPARTDDESSYTVGSVGDLTPAPSDLTPAPTVVDEPMPGPYSSETSDTTEGTGLIQLPSDMETSYADSTQGGSSGVTPAPSAAADATSSSTGVGGAATTPMPTAVGRGATSSGSSGAATFTASPSVAAGEETMSEAPVGDTPRDLQFTSSPSAAPSAAGTFAGSGARGFGSASPTAAPSGAIESTTSDGVRKEGSYVVFASAFAAGFVLVVAAFG